MEWVQFNRVVPHYACIEANIYPMDQVSKTRHISVPLIDPKVYDMC